MAYDLSFSPEFFGDIYESQSTDLSKPTNVADAITNFWESNKEGFKEYVEEYFPEYASHVDSYLPEGLMLEIMDKIRDVNTCGDISSPVDVWLDPEGWYTVDVFDDFDEEAGYGEKHSYGASKRLALISTYLKTGQTGPGTSEIKSAIDSITTELGMSFPEDITTQVYNWMKTYNPQALPDYTDTNRPSRSLVQVQQPDVEEALENLGYELTYQKAAYNRKAQEDYAEKLVSKMEDLINWNHGFDITEEEADFIIDSAKALSNMKISPELNERLEHLSLTALTLAGEGPVGRELYGLERMTPEEYFESKEHEDAVYDRLDRIDYALDHASPEIEEESNNSRYPMQSALKTLAIWDEPGVERDKYSAPQGLAESLGAPSDLKGKEDEDKKRRRRRRDKSCQDDDSFDLEECVDRKAFPFKEEVVSKVEEQLPMIIEDLYVIEKEDKKH